MCPEWHREPEDVARCDLKFLIDIFFRIVAEIVFDVLIKLPGIFLTTRLRIDSDPDGAFVWLIGCVFWAFVIGGIWGVVHFI